MKDFYISYHNSDLDKAQWIATLLEENDHTISLRAWDSQPKIGLKEMIKEGSGIGDSIILLLTPNYLDIRGSFNDWINICEPPIKKEYGRLIPVKVQRCQVDFLFPNSTYIDLVGLEEQEAEYLFCRIINSLQTMVLPKTGGKKERFIKILPSIWNIPSKKNQNFTGRKGLLAKVRLQIISGLPKSNIQMLYGFSGIGKTQIALEYAYRYAEHYSMVWWIRSNTSISMLDDFKLLGRFLKLPQVYVKEESFLIEALKKWLENNSEWLLIFDNAENPEELIKLFPTNVPGHIIITSQNSELENLATLNQVPKFNESESIEFISKKIAVSDIETSRKLARTLDFHPFALEGACSYISRENISINEYIRCFEESLKIQPLDLDNREDFIGVFPSFDIILQKIEKTVPKAIEFLKLISFLSHDEIPLETFSKGIQFIPSELKEAIEDEKRFDESLTLLHKHSLIDFKKSAFSPHKLIQDFIRSKIEQDEKNKWISTVVNLMNHNFEFDEDDTGSWSKIHSLVPHIYSVLKYAEENQIGFLLISNLFNKIGKYFIHGYEISKAEEIIQKALDYSQRAEDKESSELSAILFNYGTVRWKQGRLDQALDLFERALEIDKKFQQPMDKKIADDHRSIGIVLWEKGRYKEALNSFNEAYKIDKTLFGENSLTVAKDLNNNGMIQTLLCNFGEAEDCFLKAIKIYENKLGFEHSKIAYFLNNLGLLYRRMGHFEKARDCFEEALEINEVLYDQEHPDFGRNYTNLGLIKLDSGDFDMAISCFNKALDIKKRILGNDHLDIAGILTYLGEAMNEIERTILAREYYNQALIILRGKYKGHHPNIGYLIAKIESLKVE